MASTTSSHYYVPHRTFWPFLGSIGLTSLVVGFSNYLNGGSGLLFMSIGVVALVVMLFGWFGEVIHESETHKYTAWEDRSFRLSMSWFIFSEIMFFAAFFGALFYARVLSVPWLGGAGDGYETNQWLWQGYQAAWPTNGPGEMGGHFESMGAGGLPAINTLILLTSGITITWAHHALKARDQLQLIWGLAATVGLGLLFIFLQAFEYIHAYKDLNLTLGSGIYGSTFFMMTGFHGLHVTLGVIILTVMLVRSMLGHFTPDNHFGFEGAAWYWHFVDVVWLILFVFVYWL